MKGPNFVHLQEKQLLWAIVDENELDAAAREHLKDCRVCREKTERLHGDLLEFGRKAEQATPSLSRPAYMPSPEPVKSGRRIGWLPVLGAAAMASLAVFFYFMGLETRSLPEFAALQSSEYLVDEDPLALEENSDSVFAEPYDVYYEITGENGVGFDDEFMDFVVPGDDEDFESELII